MNSKRAKSAFGGIPWVEGSLFLKREPSRSALPSQERHRTRWNPEFGARTSMPESSPFSPRTEIEILFCRRLHAIGLVAEYQHCSSNTRPIATIRGPTESSAAVLSTRGEKRPAKGRRLGRNRVRSQRVANQTSRRRRPSWYGSYDCSLGSMMFSSRH